MIALYSVTLVLLAGVVWHYFLYVGAEENKEFLKRFGIRCYNAPHWYKGRRWRQLGGKIIMARNTLADPAPDLYGRLVHERTHKERDLDPVKWVLWWPYREEEEYAAYAAQVKAAMTAWAVRDRPGFQDMRSTENWQLMRAVDNMTARFPRGYWIPGMNRERAEAGIRRHMEAS